MFGRAFVAKKARLKQILHFGLLSGAATGGSALLATAWLFLSNFSTAATDVVIDARVVEEARKEPAGTGQRIIQIFNWAADVVHHRGPRHRELVQEVARISSTESTDPSRVGSLPEAFHEPHNGPDRGKVHAAAAEWLGTTADARSQASSEATDSSAAAEA